MRGGLILLIPLMTGFASIIWLIPIIAILGLFISLITSDKIPRTSFYIKDVIPEWFLNEFDPRNFTDRALRLEIWQKQSN